MRKQVNKMLLGGVLDSAENVAKVLNRIQLMVADISKDRHEASEAYASFWTADKETVMG